jgi:hypothetical protein
MRTLVWTRFAGALATLGLFASPVARAQTAAAPSESVRLVWVRGPNADDCPTRADLERSVSARLGRPVFSDSAQRAIEGFVQRDGTRWEAHIYARDAAGALGGSRDLASQGADCGALASAVALAIALVIDPDAALRPPARALDVVGAVSAGPEPLPTPRGATPPPQPPAPCPAQRACPESPRPATTSGANPTTVVGRAVLAGGLLPGTSVGFGLSADVPVSRGVDVGVGALLLPEVRTSDRAFGFSLMAARVGACRVPWGRGAVSFSFCADALVGAIDAVVYVDEPTQPGGRLWAGAGGTAKLAVRLLGPAIAEIGGTAVVPLVRSRFFVENQPGTVFQEPAVSGVAFAGLGVSIP